MPQYALLPPAGIGGIMGLLEAMRETPGPDDLSAVAHRLHCGLDELLPPTRAAEQLGLIVLIEGDVDLTDAGLRMAEADERERRVMFRERIQPLPVFRHLLDVLGRSPGVPRVTMQDALAAGLGTRVSDRVLNTAINWGRYAELFDYDMDTEQFVQARLN